MSLFNILRRAVGTKAVDICLDVFDMFGQLTGVFMATLGRFGVSPGYFQVIFLMFLLIYSIVLDGIQVPLNCHLMMFSYLEIATRYSVIFKWPPNGTYMANSTCSTYTPYSSY